MNDPRLSLCMITRNEADCIGDCLQSAAPYVDEMILVDTGSEDETVIIAQTLGAKVYSLPWENDFAKARNFSLEKATGDWILYLDADEKLDPDDGPMLRGLLADPSAEGYFLLELNHFTANWDQDFAPHITPRLFRNRPEYRFAGRIHEMIEPNIFQARLPLFKKAYSIRIHHFGYMINNPKLPHKIARNLELLLSEIALNPDDPFLCFNLGTEYFRMGKYHEAYEYYIKAREQTPKESLILPRLIKNMVVLLVETGRLEEAKRHIWRGLLDLPDFNELYYLWGDLAFKEGKFTLALQCYSECRFLKTPPPYYNTVAGLETYRASIAMARCFRVLKQPWLEALELMVAIKDDSGSDCKLLLQECLQKLKPEERAQITYDIGTRTSSILGQ
jgi:glycosyltransferase involved in cell wall biosynthesis